MNRTGEQPVEEELMCQTRSAPRLVLPLEGAADIALFLPFDCSKGRQRAAKPGTRRNRKTA
jgi:hypothetical protein